MVKLFFVGLGVFVVIVVATFTSILTPLMMGVDGNLGGPPKMPFHAPIPQPVIGAIDSLTQQATPSVLLTGVLGLAALLFVYTLGAALGHGINRHKEKRRRWAELKWRARAITARQYQESTATPPPAPSQASADIEALWK